MSRLTLTMKSLLAIGAATALTITASADVTKPTQPTTDEAKSAVAGSGAGKANFQDLSVTAKGGDIESEGDLALNGIAAPNDKLGPIKGESQDRAAAIKFEGVEGESKDPEWSAGPAGCEPYPACARNKEAVKGDLNELDAEFNELDAEFTEMSVTSEGSKPVAGAALTEGRGGEDRLTENVSIASGPNGMMPEVDLDAPRPQGGNDPIPGIDIITKSAPEDK